MRLWRWVLALAALLAHRRSSGSGGGPHDGRIVPEATPSPRAEVVVAILLLIAAAFAAGFVAAYGLLGAQRLPNELLGVCLGLSLLFVAAAFVVVAKRLVVTEELEEEYPVEHPEEQEAVARIVRESGSGFTRRRMLVGAGGLAAGALGLAAITPAVSLGPIWDTGPLDESPWRRGRRLVDENDKPMLASDIEPDTFYTAFPEGADKEFIGSSVVVVRLSPSSLRLPPGRRGWAPYGIVAYSKICTHAGCAIALYRKPLFPQVEPRPELVCPCHYSTFDPATGAAVTYGPAGRPLPQLPLMVDAAGYLRAAGNFSERVGPGWWNVRRPPTFVRTPS